MSKLLHVWSQLPVLTTKNNKKRLLKNHTANIRDLKNNGDIFRSAANSHSLVFAAFIQKHEIR